MKTDFGPNHDQHLRWRFKPIIEILLCGPEPNRAYRPNRLCSSCTSPSPHCRLRLRRRPGVAAFSKQTNRGGSASTRRQPESLSTEHRRVVINAPPTELRLLLARRLMPPQPHQLIRREHETHDGRRRPPTTTTTDRRDDWEEPRGRQKMCFIIAPPALK